MREIKLKVNIFQPKLDDENTELKGPKVSRKMHVKIRYSDFMLLLVIFHFHVMKNYIKTDHAPTRRSSASSCFVSPIAMRVSPCFIMLIEVGLNSISPVSLFIATIIIPKSFLIS